MASARLTKECPIIIVGAGVFGLSSALHLSQAGYKDITVFDKQPYAENEYSTARGADAASADLNKVMRMSYGEEIEYQRLAFDGVDTWNAWNREIQSSKPEDLPRGLKPSDLIWNNCGFLRMSTDGRLSAMERATLGNMTREGLRQTQFVIGDPEDEERARSHFQPGEWEKKSDPFGRRRQGKELVGVFDSTAGFVEASKACTWVMHLCRKNGVRFVLGKRDGQVASFIKDGNGKTVGIRTVGSAEYRSKLVILAAGSWTPYLFPAVSSLLETTAGSVVFFQLPPRDRAPDLWDRFSPENFPVFSYGGWSNGHGIGGFPRTENGIVKIGYRGTKYTNYEDVLDPTTGRTHRISVPKTAYWPQTYDPAVTKQAVDAIKEVVKEAMPELAAIGITGCRNCWYTDSLDNGFLVDYVPNDEGMVVCSGGSGHGFKFLPTLGREVVKIIEEPEVKNDYGRLWQWRTKEGPKNGLEQGEAGPRNWKKQIMATKEDWKFEEASRI
ncbi:FAD dependent oxidoreductase [Durotheca rogersii]|uniref:FAD dependent oxidoreductase n=1 Tax=Durotheca rogersii TaxID=419775 RepID=UPI00221EA2B8|nr:FAD dependent oxidoreductase [Durotheca rogersii]KAI5866534.1 FAD dependent oxidoreductase [Durotheca rogersii]